jgi:hypothetical protein
MERHERMERFLRGRPHEDDRWAPIEEMLEAPVEPALEEERLQMGEWDDTELAENVMPSRMMDALGGYVANGADAPASSISFSFWSSPDATAIGVGSLVRHLAQGPDGASIATTGVVVAAQGVALGLDRTEIDAIERDGAPPSGVLPRPSRRRPITTFRVRVLRSDDRMTRPVGPGPVSALAASELGSLTVPDDVEDTILIIVGTC